MTKLYKFNFLTKNFTQNQIPFKNNEELSTEKFPSYSQSRQQKEKLIKQTFTKPHVPQF